MSDAATEAARELLAIASKLRELAEPQHDIADQGEKWGRTTAQAQAGTLGNALDALASDIDHIVSLTALSEALTPVGLEWQPISTAPKSTAEGHNVRGVYLLGYCPADDMDPMGCMSAIWWEPLTRCTVGKRRGMMGTWFGEGALESEPTHWMPLPPPPIIGAIDR